MNQASQRSLVPVEANSLGVAAFVLGILGIVSGGVFAPIALILGLIAMGREPRGFAVAGLILGLVGSCGGLVIAGLILAGVLFAGAAAVVVATVVLSEPEKSEVSLDFAAIAVAVEEYTEREGYPPAGIGDLGLPIKLTTDPWEGAYRLEPTTDRSFGIAFDVVSDGPDRVQGTEDDVRLTAIDELWRAEFDVRADQIADEGWASVDEGIDAMGTAAPDTPGEPGPDEPDAPPAGEGAVEAGGAGG